MALKDIIGQDKAVSILLRTLSRDRLPSAYLFSGEAGIGKKLTAINLAKVINCLSPVNGQQSSVVSQKNNLEDLQTIDYRLTDSCDECPSCRKIDAGTHPDFVLITPEKGEIRVGEIRAVEEALSLKPYEGRKKIVVIDDADAMNQSAANAFLKTLEEPPDESLLVLVAANPDKLPETIRSRCSRVSFSPLSSSACEKVIASLSEQPAPGAGKKSEDADRIPVLVRLSMGRPGLAISSDRLKERERFIGLLQNMIGGQGETWSDREEIERWLDMMFLTLRDMAVLKVGEEALLGKTTSTGGALFNADKADFIASMAGMADLRSIVENYRKMSLLKKRLSFNLNKAITWNYVSAILQENRLERKGTNP